MTYIPAGLAGARRVARPQYRVLARFRGGDLTQPLFKGQPTEDIDEARKSRDTLRESTLHFWDDAQLAKITSARTHQILEQL